MIDTLSFYLELINENYILSVFIVVYLGLIFGSLLNVLSSRMIIMENINNIGVAKSIGVVKNKAINSYYDKYKNYNLFFPKSSCPNCSYSIKWWQNIPVLGFLLIRGKCFGCKSKISFEYPIVELIITLSFVLNFILFGLSINFIIYSSLFYFLSLHFLTDIKEKVLFDSITLIIFMILSVSLLMNGDIHEIRSSFYTSFSLYLFMYAFIYGYEKLRNIEHSFGRGDIKLIAALSVCLNINEILYFILISTFIGMVSFLLLMILNKKERELPFAPSIIISFYITLMI